MQFNNLGKQWECIRENTLKRIDEIGHEGSYINGKSVSDFEQEFALHYDSMFGVAVSNGTDGLKLGLQTYNLTEDDAVIMPAHTFIADYIAVKHLPLTKPKVILIDHDDFFTLDMSHLELFMRTCRHHYKKVVVIAVHLYGHPCDMDKLMPMSAKYNFNILEDCSQSHESTYKNKTLGTYGDMAVYSLYPGKNLGAMGDAGIITTHNKELYERLKSLRNYGSKVKYHYDELGHNHRLDSVQALVLSEKLKHIKEWTDRKLEIVNRYLTEINNPKVTLPKIANYTTKHSFHVFALLVEGRSSFESHMSEAGIPTIIHYPIPIYKTKVWDQTDIVFSHAKTKETSDKVISIPIHPFMSEEEVNLVINTINSY